MKNNFLKPMLFLVLASMVFMGSCKKKIDEAYLNPNPPLKPAIETILPGVIGGMAWFSSNAGSAYGLQVDGTFIGRFIQYWGINSTGDSWGQMNMIGGAVDNGGSVWAMFYYAHGQNVNRIIQWGTEQEKWDYVGVGWALRAWGLLELTNEYSDAPLKEALNFDPSVLQTQFHYDTQPEFYDSCRTICHRALSFLNRTDGNVSKANLAIGDAYFNGGDVNKWKKFVYGVLARSFINLSSKDLFKANNYAFADSAIKYAGLAMAGNDDNASVKVSGGPTTALNNFWGPFRVGTGATIGTGLHRQGAYIADLMSGNIDSAFKGVADPRRWYMLSENLNTASDKMFKGFLPWSGGSNTSGNDYPKNFWRNPSPTSTSTYDSGRYVFQNASPWPIMTASEMQFIIAEALLRKGDPVSKGNALLAYKNAIFLNFEMLTTTYNQNIPAGKQITNLTRDAYLSDPLVAPAVGTSLTLTHIMLQKYIALFGWGSQQTWVDMRKFHYTDIDPTATPNKKVYTGLILPAGTSLASTNGGKYIYRLRPRFNSEFLYNVPELTRIGAYQNLDYNTYEMWFSMK